MLLDILSFDSAAQEEAAQAAADSAKVAIRRATEELVNDPNQFFSDFLQHAIDFGLKLLAAIIIYAVGAWLIRRINKWLTKRFERRKTEKTIASFTTSVVTITLTVLLIIMTIGALGINTTSLAALLAAGGMAIGMALSGTVQNFAGGIMILLFKPFKVGDYIKAQGYEGYVTDVSIVSTKIRTFANSIIILPNGSLFNGTIDNFSDKPYHRETWKVGVPYDTDVNKAKEVIMKILDGESRIIRGKASQGIPEPSIYVNELKDSSVELVVWAWVKVEDYWPVLFKINEEIYTVMPQEGISFPFPQMDVHVKS